MIVITTCAETRHTGGTRMPPVDQSVPEMELASEASSPPVGPASRTATPLGAVEARAWRIAARTEASRSVRSILNRRFFTVHADSPVGPVAQALLAGEVDAVLVLGEEGRVVGIVEPAGLAKAVYQRDTGDGAAPARSVMRRVSFELPADATVAQAAALMAYEQLAVIPVVGEARRPAGVVTAIDVAHWLAHQEGYLLPERERKSSV